MTFSTDTEIAALVLTVVVHLIGAGALIWGMLDREDPDRGSWRDWWPRDDRGGDGPSPPPAPRSPGGATVPVLPGSRPPAGRVREGARLGDLSPRPVRRPAHPPAPSPSPGRLPAGDAG